MVWMEKIIGDHISPPSPVVPFPDLDAAALQASGIEPREEMTGSNIRIAKERPPVLIEMCIRDRGKGAADKGGKREPGNLQRVLKGEEHSRLRPFVCGFLLDPFPMKTDFSSCDSIAGRCV